MAVSMLLHIAVFAVLIVDLIFGSSLVHQFAGRWASFGFEFVLILGYIIFVLQWGVPWGRRGDDDG